MARPPFDEIAAAQLGRRLTELHHAAGSPSYPWIYEQILVNHHVSCTDENIRRMHLGKADPNTTSIESLLGVAWFYGVDAADLHPAIERRLARLFAMAGGPGPSDDDPDPAASTPPGTRTQNLRINAVPSAA